MKRYKGLGRVFSFTLTQQLRQRGWRTATIAVALACLLIPILSLTVAAQHQKNAAPEQNPVMEEGYTQEALDRAELTPEQRVLLTAPVEVTVTGGQTGEGETMGLLSMLLPFASLMLLYFLVLLYGQSTAASVILEKTSKLMDLFLVSVEPGAMVLGKVLATALAGLLQLAVWAAGLAGGFAIGGAVVRQTGVTLPLLEVLGAMEPYGSGNPAPLFGLFGMRLESVTPVGGGKHLRLRLSRDGTVLTAMKFGTPPQDFHFSPGDEVNLAVSLDRNEYQGNVSVSVFVKDIRYASTRQDDLLAALREAEAAFRGELAAPLPVPTRDQAGRVYRFLAGQKGYSGTIEQLFHTIRDESLTYTGLLLILETLRQAGLIRMDDQGEILKIGLLPAAGKTDLAATPLMQYLGSLHRAETA